MFRVNSDGKNYLAIYWYLTNFFAENHVISHAIIFLAEANELIQSLGGCVDKFHKIICLTLVMEHLLSKVAEIQSENFSIF